jgi:outer membrane protein assembly factor BamB
MDDPQGRRERMEAEMKALGLTAIGANFTRFDGVPAEDIEGAWPCFRGPQRDNISRETVPLAESWGDGTNTPPPALWAVDLGEGFAGPAVWKGRVFVLDYDEAAQEDALRCFSLADGREIWRRSYSVPMKINHGYSRTVPAVTDRHVVTFGPRCHVMSCDPDSGGFQWGIDLHREYGSQEPGWYAGQCPLIDGDEVILAPAGTNVLLMGVELASGTVRWTTPNPRGWQMSHASVATMTLNGRRMYVYSAVGGISGVSADAADRGALLWASDAWTHSTIAPTPVCLPDGRIFVTAGYGGGSMMLRVAETNGAYSVSELGRWKPGKGLSCEQHTPVLLDGRLLGILPKDAGPLRSQFVCYHPDDCGTPVWTSGKTERFGLGPFMLADGKIFVLDDNGVLAVLRASTAGYALLSRARVLDGHDSWAPLALAGGRLLVRDSRRMVCLDIRRKEG